MAYGRFTGEGGAFGWCLDGRITLGGLPAHADLTLVGEREQIPITTDAQGAWSGRMVHDVPLCVARESRVLLYDESRIGAPAAAALVAVRREPPVPREEPVPREQPPAPSEPPPPPMEDTPVPASTVYRAPSKAPSVDALPSLAWPRQAEQLKPYFDTLPPIRLFDAPGWRFVRAREAGMNCCFGICSREDRVAEVLYGVRARGGMIPPKGLQGYSYRQALDGAGYWVLQVKMNEED